MSCWDECPISTYLNDAVTPTVCSDCPTYCRCEKDTNTTCLECMNSTFFFDRVRNQCLLKCPQSTTYSNASETCLSCSPYCLECDGFTEFDCTECIDGLVQFTLPNNKKICVDRNCDPGNYFDEETANCEACAVECEECDGASNSECLSCSYTH